METWGERSVTHLHTYEKRDTIGYICRKRGPGGLKRIVAGDARGRGYFLALR